ncbi:MAG: hypothetical protein K940chlam7_02106, partial [Chlamydiae bacterium]|nr:hypothetical protein [Chlamydiota bacterium]
MSKPANQKISPPSGLDICFRGPPLDIGPLPALYYFALSGHDSLFKDPYNQPILFLEDAPIRIYSSTLPSHGPELKDSDAMQRWAKEIQNDHDIFTEFIEGCSDNIDFLIQQGFLDETKLAAGGISRGGFMATQLAAYDSRVKVVLAFAPLTTFDTIKEFQKLLQHPIVRSLELKDRMEKLIDKKIRYYIGNRDTRVGTDVCFQFIHNLTEVAYRK